MSLYRSCCRRLRLMFLLLFFAPASVSADVLAEYLFWDAMGKPWELCQKS